MVAKPLIGVTTQGSTLRGQPWHLSWQKQGQQWPLRHHLTQDTCSSSYFPERSIGDSAALLRCAISEETWASELCQD